MMVKAERALTQPIPYEIGIRQRDSLSTLKLNLIRHEIIKIEMKKGYRREHKQIQMICYADDAVIIAVNEENLQKLIKQFEDTSSH